MKLSQIYANKKFKKVRFNDDLNLVLARVTKKDDLKKDSHNLGKTTLIAVIDFMLLKSIDKKHFFKKFEIFNDHVFFLEILLNDGDSLTIRRSVEKATKISFKRHKSRHQNFLTEEDWDESEMPIEKAREYLNSALKFNILPDWEYRKSVTYFLRSQEDYRDVFQLAKFSKGKDVDWKPFLFDLLGFEGNLLKDKYELEQSRDKQIELIDEFKTQLSVDPKEIDKIRGAIEIKREEREEIEKYVERFNFYEKERGLNKELVESIEKDISELNTLEYDLSYEIEQIEQSLQANSLTSFEEIKKVWEEAQLFFNTELIKKYEELEEFNRKISEERIGYLNSRLADLKRNLSKVREELLIKNDERAKILSVLTDKDTFHKFKNYQKELTNIEAEIIRLEEQLKNINKIDLLNDTVKEYDKKIDDVKSKIKEELDSSRNSIYPEIRKNFRKIIKDILDVPSILFLVQNTVGNIEFNAEIQNKDEIELTAEGKGFSYKKFLCMAFDLAILISYSKKSFFRFVYHDGALEGLDNRKKLKFLDQVRKVTTENNVQYIFTSIEDDLPKKANEPIKFSDLEIAVILNDSGDEGKLFEMSF